MKFLFTTTALGYFIYWLLVYSNFSKKFISRNLKIEDGSVKRVAFNRIAGFVFLGLLPVFLIKTFTSISFGDIGLNYEIGKEKWIWLSVLVPILLMANLYNSPLEDNLKHYPQIRKKNWSYSTFFIEYFTWFLFMLGYEAFFRGVFLFGCYEVFGFWYAIILNIIVYVLAHIPKGKKEMIVSIPYGGVLAYLTLVTGNIFVAFVSHIILAISNSILSFRANEEMVFQK